MGVVISNREAGEAKTLVRAINDGWGASMNYVCFHAGGGLSLDDHSLSRHFERITNE